jgi:hypothetical protein
MVLSHWVRHSIRPAAKLLLAASCSAVALMPAGAQTPTDPAKARACADRLNPPARMMYDHVAPKVKSSSKIPDLMRAEVPSLVFGGKLSRELAQKNAPSAGQCLLLLK